MANSFIKRPPATSIRLTMYDKEIDRVTEVAKRLGLDFGPALRVIINQHAEWEKQIRIAPPSEPGA